MKECDRVRGVNYLDIIRIIATSMVLIVHLFQYVTISTPQLSLIFSLTRYGDRGVPIFFCL